MERIDLPAQVAAYASWLARRPLAPATHRAYLLQVRLYVAYLTSPACAIPAPFLDPDASLHAVRDYKTYLKTVRRVKPSSVNLALAAIDSFYAYLGLDRPAVRREDLPRAAPRALAPAEQVRFLRAVERCPVIRNRAIAHLLFYTGIRLGECAALNVDDVPLSARKGRVIVRAGKGDSYREIPLNAAVRTSLQSWLTTRRQAFPDSADPALFLAPAGGRLSSRAIDLLLRQLGTAAGLPLSAHILRHTCLTTLVRNGTDLVLVAELAGHTRLETTRRYSLPTARDREAAMERLQVEY
ncbi:MAG: tyrosine-type recombinase/integrase [Chloroflexi bacterium]|nr:tyrosine-type recombinase/integrase [Chloroflexota bacterium]